MIVRWAGALHAPPMAGWPFLSFATHEFFARQHMTTAERTNLNDIMSYESGAAPGGDRSRVSFLRPPPRDPRRDKKPAPPCRSLSPRFRCDFCALDSRGEREGERVPYLTTSAQCCRKNSSMPARVEHAPPSVCHTRSQILTPKAKWKWGNGVDSRH